MRSPFRCRFPWPYEGVRCYCGLTALALSDGGIPTGITIGFASIQGLLSGDSRCGFAPTPKQFHPFFLLLIQIIPACRECCVDPVDVARAVWLKLNKHHILAPTVHRYQKLLATMRDKFRHRIKPCAANLITVIRLDVGKSVTSTIRILNARVSRISPAWRRIPRRVP